MKICVLKTARQLLIKALEEKLDDNWLKTCALYLIAEMKDDRYNDIIPGLVDDADPIVKETAEYCLGKVGNPN